MKLPLLLPVLLLVGCAGGSMTNVPNLYVDEGFGADLDKVDLAVESYAPAGVAVRIAVMNRDNLIRVAETHSPNSIYLFTTHRLDEADCPFLDEAVILAGVTKESGGSAVTCIDVDYIHETKTPEGVELVMRRAIAHELGHALMGPEHFGSGLMENSYVGAVVPQCDDYRRLVASVPNTVLPARCR